MIKRLEIAFTSDDYGDYPKFINVEITKDVITDLKKALKILDSTKGYFSINLNADIYLDDEDTSDFKIGVAYITIYDPGTCYVYASSKHNSQSNIESSAITLEELEQEFKNS